MPRYKLTLEYDGTPLVGWQRQTNGASVQGAVEEAIRGFSGEEVTVTAAGRTDTGVHARGQVISFDLSRGFAADTVRDAMNAHLRPNPIAVIAATEAPPDSARAFQPFSGITNTGSSAGARRWCSILTARGGMCRRWVRTPWRGAAQALIGKHDFSTFRAAECQAKSPIKTLDEARIESADANILFHFSARSFLHSQVRSMVGSLAQVARQVVGR